MLRRAAAYLRARAWLLAPALVGAGLRLARLRDQVLGADELHALRVALEASPAGLVAYRFDANAPPLNLTYRLLLELGVPVGETLARLPMLACGVALLLLAPRALAPLVGRAPAVLLAWMLALSPSLVLYSRIARAYAPVVLLAFLAAMAAFHWLRTSAPRHAVQYAVAGGLAVYCHLGAAPFVLAPVPFAAAQRLLAGPRDRRALVSLALLAGGVLAIIAILLLPSLPSLLWLSDAVRRQREVHAALDADSVLGTATLLLGTPPRWLLSLFSAAVLRGLAVLARTQPRFAAYAVWLLTAQVAGLLVLAPLQLHQPLMFARYALPTLPFLLAFAAVGLAAPWSPAQGPRARRVQALAAWALLAAALLEGPLAGSWSRSLLHHNDYVGFHRTRGTLPAEAVPAFYRDLDEGGHGAIIEFPLSTWWNYARAVRIYQELHGRRVIASSWEQWLYDPRLGLRNSVPPRPDAYLASPARWAVIHRDMGAEEARVREAPGSLAAELHPRMTAAMRERAVSAAHRLLPALERAWGPPDYDDGDIAVWDLERVREAAPASGPVGPAGPADGRLAG